MTERSLGSAVKCDACGREVVLPTEVPELTEQLKGWWFVQPTPCVRSGPLTGEYSGHVCDKCADKPLTQLLQEFRERRSGTRTCTCAGTCKGSSGLAEGWVCALETHPQPFYDSLIRTS